MEFRADAGDSVPRHRKDRLLWTRNSVRRRQNVACLERQYEGISVCVDASVSLFKPMTMCVPVGLPITSYQISHVREYRPILSDPLHSLANESAFRRAKLVFLWCFVVLCGCVPSMCRRLRDLSIGLACVDWLIITSKCPLWRNTLINTPRRPTHPAATRLAGGGGTC